MDEKLERQIKTRVLTAAIDLVAAFGQSDFERYFRCFDVEAWFEFYFAPERIRGLEAWRLFLERSILDDGLQIISCTGSNGTVHVVSETEALYCHEVTTVESTTKGGVETLYELEEITFRLVGGRWLAVSEVLTRDPRYADPPPPPQPEL